MDKSKYPYYSLDYIVENGDTTVYNYFMNRYAIFENSISSFWHKPIKPDTINAYFRIHNVSNSREIDLVGELQNFKLKETTSMNGKLLYENFSNSNEAIVVLGSQHEFYTYYGIKEQDNNYKLVLFHAFDWSSNIDICYYLNESMVSFNMLMPFIDKIKEQTNCG